MMLPNEILLLLEKAYGLKFSEKSLRPFGQGHIHQTFKIESGEKPYILQGFNHQVFKYPDRIANNLNVLTQNLDLSSLPFILPLPLPNAKEELFTLIEDKYYRISPFIHGSCLESMEDENLAYMAAEAFAIFCKSGLHLDAESVFQESIPGFHDFALRYSQLRQAAKETKRKLGPELSSILDFYLNQANLVEPYKIWQKVLPKRLTHNDSKINNLIFSEDLKKVEAIIDLDTVMAGFLMVDFGDLVRTVACTLPESSLDFDDIEIHEELYKALWEGFVAGCAGEFTSEELNSLYYGGMMMTGLMGMRFLADYLNGNIYYQISYEEQNLHRSKNQMQLLKSMIQKRSALDTFNR